MKLVAAVLPILIAMFVSNLVQVLNYAGIIGFFIAFFFPAFLHLRSQWVCFQTFRNILRSGSKLNGYGSHGNETTPLLGGVAEQSFSRDLLEFFFTTKHSDLYKTPYSMFFSYPIFVVVIGVVSFMTLVFTIVSLIV